MPRPIAPALRRAAWNRAQCGQSVSSIAQELQLVPRSVRRILQQIRSRGEAALTASYIVCGRQRAGRYGPLRRRVRQLRAQHPRWGAGRIRLELNTSLPVVELPSERTLQRWLCTAPPAPAGRPARADVARASVPHAVWQMDAAEQKHLAGGQAICWLRVADECSGAVLKTVVFSLRTLRSGSSRNGPAAPASRVFAVGTAGRPARRQRGAVGFVERPAHGVGAVAHRTGD